MKRIWWWIHKPIHTFTLSHNIKLIWKSAAGAHKFKYISNKKAPPFVHLSIINILYVSHFYPDSSADSCLALKAEQNDGENDAEKGGEKEVKAEGFVSTLEVEGGKWVEAYTQKNISFEGKPVTPTGKSGGFSEVFSLRDQLKQAEERASQVQREVRHVN